MPKSRFIEAERLKPFIVYLAAAFLVVLLLGTAVPPGPPRTVLVLAWLLLFPIGGWKILNKPAN
ncbi:MAG: hypothetical protein OXU33_12820 [Gemmatimonadota bacterium]|nr:hypothetical protein [Gemmatimonadota bacterium]MDE3004489.1 hypothetical protein [Gemmatimonadota bacterium]MDE3014945.1 hypothetical protein [Gemmatimonadota bacterium]